MIDALEKVDFVQIRLWKDCINNCKFCYLKAHSDRNTTTESRKKRLVNAAELVKTIKAEKIGLIGGEFFEGQLKGCEDEWFSFIDALKNSNSEIFITANLIHEQYLLKETIEALDNEVLICTSYDEEGRFHTEKDKEHWFDLIASLHDQGVSVFCNSVATQDFFESKANFPEWLQFNLVDPHISLEWIFEVDKNEYHNKLLKECDFFNFPNRRTTIAWFKAHPQTTRNYVNYSTNHSDLIYGFNAKDEPEPELQHRHTNSSFINPKCEHPYISTCYADSDKCMMCDAKRVLDEMATTEMLNQKHSKTTNIKMFQ